MAGADVTRPKMQAIHNTTLSFEEAFVALPSDVQQKVFMCGLALPNVCKESRANFRTRHGKVEFVKTFDADKTPKPVKRKLLFQLNVEALREELVMTAAPDAGHQH